MPQITPEEALARYRRAVKPARADQYVALVQRWLAWGGQPTDASLSAYLHALQRQGYKPSTCDLAARTIRAFYRHLGIPAPRVVGFAWDPLQDTDRPAVALDAMRALMQAVHNPDSALDRYQRAILAVSLVYGPRANELAALQPQDVEATRIYIRTSKHGQARWLWVPSTIREVLDIDWPTVTTTYVERQFGTIWAAVFETEKPARVAWHAIRRGLAHALSEAGVSDGAIEHFMRWKAPGGKQSMVALYKNPNRLVGAQGNASIRKTEADEYNDDAAVWEQHPLIKKR